MDFVFAPGAEPGDFRAGGNGWGVNWMGGRITQRSVEAARLAIDETNKRAADLARETHGWSTVTGQTEASVFTRPAHYSQAKEDMWGTWGVRDDPREPIRLGNPTNPDYERYEGKVLTMKDVALLLEFGFHLRNRDGSLGGYRQYPWLYPAWNATRGQMPGLMAMYYQTLGANFRYRLLGTNGIPGQFLNLAQVYSRYPGGWKP